MEFEIDPLLKIEQLKDLITKKRMDIPRE